MILSLSHRFIFVHIPKTAGSAMTDALRRFGRGKVRTLGRSLTRRLPMVEPPETAHFRVHEPARVMIRKLSRPVWDGFHSFSVVRNPFDHAVSHYEYMKQYRSAKWAARFAAMGFEEYLSYRLAPPKMLDRIFARLPDQTYYLLDEAGAVAVNRLIRFEALAEEFPRLVADLGLEGATLRRVNKTRAKSDRRPFQSYYDATTLDMVRRLYARDFTTLGYDTALPALPAAQSA